MDTHYFKRRSREIKEWWLLRTDDPGAIERQQQRDTPTAGADQDSPPWPGTSPDGTSPASGGAGSPAPVGPQKREMAALGGIGIVAVLVFAGIGSAVGPTKPSPVAAFSATSTTPTPLPTVTTVTPSPSTKATATKAADLPAVPVGQPQTIEGQYDGHHYKAIVTVTAVSRTTDTSVVIKAKIDVVDGELPISGGWSATTTAGKVLPGLETGDAAFGDLVTGTVEGESEVFAGETAKIKDVRLQPPHEKRTRKSLNETAVWSVDKLTTSITTSEPAPEPTTAGTDSDAGDSPNGGNPNVNVPNVNVPNVGDCVNGHRRSNGQFC